MRAIRCTVLLLAAGLWFAPRQSPAAGPDSLAAAARRDSLVAADSSFSDYFVRRERFSYPATSRQDPFDSPFGRNRGGEALGPSLAEMQLTGVLYSPDGLSVAILSLPTGDTYLLHEGDWLGGAEVSLIEKTRIHFRINEFGTLRTLVKELKPLVEDDHDKSPEDAGEADRPQQESGTAEGESTATPR